MAESGPLQPTQWVSLQVGDLLIGSEHVSASSVCKVVVTRFGTASLGQASDRNLLGAKAEGPMPG